MQRKLSRSKADRNLWPREKDLAWALVQRRAATLTADIDEHSGGPEDVGGKD